MKEELVRDASGEDGPDVVLTERAGGVLTLTLNRPYRLNALSRALVERLGIELEKIADDEDIRVVVLTGAGRGFCSGGDLNARITEDQGGTQQTPGTLRSELRHATRISQLLHTMPAITIAAINGPCAGAGLSLACASDLRYCSSDAIFTTAFLEVAMSGDYGISYSLPRIVGSARAREMLFMPERMNAESALAINLVNAIYPSDTFRLRVAEIAGRIAKSPAAALRRMKCNLVESEMLGLAELLDRESARQVECRLEPDAERTAIQFLACRPSRSRDTNQCPDGTRKERQ